MFGIPIPLVALLSACAGGVQNLIEFWIHDVQFIRIDADDRTILLMEFLDVESVLTTENHIVVELVPCANVRTMMLRDNNIYPP